MSKCQKQNLSSINKTRVNCDETSLENTGNKRTPKDRTKQQNYN